MFKMAARFQRFQRHPFALATTLTDSFVLLFAVDIDALQRFCPPGLELEQVGNYGLVALATVRAVDLRLRGAPRWLGHSFMLTGYRVVVRFRAPDGTIRRALRIIQSDTDSRMMQLGGNLFTEYNYSYRTIKTSHEETPERGSLYRVRICDSQGAPTLDISGRIDTDDFLPDSSPFATPREARRFTGPLPWTVGYVAHNDSFVAVRGHREHWKPRLVEPLINVCSFLEQPAFANYNVRLAAAFYIDAVPYSWDRGLVLSAESVAVSRSTAAITAGPGSDCMADAVDDD
jgi:hypothetical protein